MPTRASKKPRQGPTDVNRMAAGILAAVTGDAPTKAPDKRNAAAVALGKLGASKGGLARAQALTAKKRKEIAKKAASKRWQKQQ